MTTTTYPTTMTRSNPGRTAAVRTFKAEWTKLMTLRSTWRAAAGAVVLSVALGGAVVASSASQWDRLTAKERLAFDATSSSLIGMLFAAVVLATLAVRSVTTEYSTGMIRSTFTALPGRRTVLAAKAATIAALAFPVALVSNLLSFEVGQRIIATKHAQVSIGHPGVVQALVLGAVAVSLVTVVGVGLGGIIRHTAGATTALSLVLIGGAMFSDLLPAGFRQYLPETAAQAVVTVHRTSGLLRPGPALAVLAVYAVVAMWLASIRVGRGDV